MKKVLLVTNIPNPYRLALFNELNSQMKEAGYDLKIIFGSAGYKRRQFQLDLSEATFHYAMLDSHKIQLGHREKTMVTYKGLGKQLKKEGKCIIIVSGFSLATMKIWLRSIFVPTKYLIWSGSVEFPGWYDSATRRFFRRLFVKRAAAFIAYGTLAKDYFKKLGAPAERIFIALNTVDTEFYAKRTERLRAAQPLPGKKHLVYVGYLEPRKNVENLVEIIKKLSEKRSDFILDIVGAGSREEMLKEMSKTLGLADWIRFHGFRQKEELPAFFAQSTCFLFQTDFDIWGLVLNEAMAAGLPCISSLNAGATCDLVMDGKNGFVADYDNHEEVIGKIEVLLNDTALARKMGDEAAKFIREQANLKVSAGGFVKALQPLTRQVVPQ